MSHALWCVIGVETEGIAPSRGSWIPYHVALVRELYTREFAFLIDAPNSENYSTGGNLDIDGLISFRR